MNEKYDEWMNELYDEWKVMNELLWDVWVDICNCVCYVLYYILMCFLFLRAK